MAKKVRVKFDEKGNSQFEGEGFEGDECIHEMGHFEEALGNVGEREMTVAKPKHKAVMRKKTVNKAKQKGT